MNTDDRKHTVSFTAKGQVVIPVWLLKEFQVERGTRAIVTSTPDGILIKPVTAKLIARGRGIVKRAAGSKPLAEEWAEHKAEERKLEDR